jgi:hypothetical protein
MVWAMIALVLLALNLAAAVFKSKSRLEAENAALRRRLIVLRREVKGRIRLNSSDRLFFVELYRWFPSILKLITIGRPETLVRRHREGFRRYWRWKSRPLGGRPPIGAELRALIRRMSLENPLWGAPRIHGELLKLGFAVAPSTVGKYMSRKRNDAHLDVTPRETFAQHCVGRPDGDRFGLLGVAAPHSVIFMRVHVPASDVVVVVAKKFGHPR